MPKGRLKHYLDWRTVDIHGKAFLNLLLDIVVHNGVRLTRTRRAEHHRGTEGIASMVCIMLLCSGVQLFCLGIVGEYLAKTYLEVKHRPIYITRETEQDRDERKPAQQK